jgi:hypothetical protein
MGSSNVAAQCSANTLVINQSWFSESIPIAFGVVKIATFSRAETFKHASVDVGLMFTAELYNTVETGMPID